MCTFKGFLSTYYPLLFFFPKLEGLVQKDLGIVTIKDQNLNTVQKEAEQSQVSSRRRFLKGIHVSAAHLPPEEALCNSQSSRNISGETAGCRASWGHLLFLYLGTFLGYPEELSILQNNLIWGNKSTSVPSQTCKNIFPLNVK